MTSIRKEFAVGADATVAWDAVRDYGAVHQLAPGFLTGSRLEGDERIVTFASGAQARERLIAVDDDQRRLVYAVVDGPLGATHHQASVEVLAGDDGTTRLVWITDLLPDELSPVVDGLMQQGSAAIARALAR